MRIGIVVVLVVFAIACHTQKATESGTPVGPLSVVQKLKGKSIPTNASSNTVKSKWRHELVGKQPGMSDATVIATSEFKTHDKQGQVDPKCSGASKYGAELTKLDFEQTYPDGSSFKGKASYPAGWPVCTDGARFFIEAEGDITSGKGKFKGAKGEWSAEIKIDYLCDEKTNSCPTEGSFSAAFEY
jgi:hypothetical protein